MSIELTAQATKAAVAGRISGPVFLHHTFRAFRQVILSLGGQDSPIYRSCRHTEALRRPLKHLSFGHVRVYEDPAGPGACV